MSNSDEYYGMFEYDFLTRECKKITPKYNTNIIPKERRSGAYVVDDNNSKMYVIGGAKIVLEDTRPCRVWEFDTKTISWKLQKKTDFLPQTRYACSCCYFRNSTLIFGFGQHWESFNDLFLYDIVNQKWKIINTKGEIPEPRGFSSFVMHSNYMYLMGGRQLSIQRFNDFYRLSTLTWKWEKLDLYGEDGKPFVLPRIAGHNMREVDDKLIIFAGNTDNGSSNKMYEIKLPKSVKGIERMKFRKFSDVKIKIEY